MSIASSLKPRMTSLPLKEAYHASQTRLIISLDASISEELGDTIAAALKEFGHDELVGRPAPGYLETHLSKILNRI